jgi:hypothetical protein
MSTTRAPSRHLKKKKAAINTLRLLLIPEAAGETTIYVSSYRWKKSGASLNSSDTYLLYCCFTAALLLLYCCFTTYRWKKARRASPPRTPLCFTFFLYCCFTAALLLLYCCFTAALLLLYCCFTYRWKKARRASTPRTPLCSAHNTQS